LSTELLAIAALVTLLTGLALLVFDVVRQHQEKRQQGRVIDRALLGPTAPADVAPDESWKLRATRWISSFGSRFENGRLGKALLTPEDRLLLSQINRNTVQGRATFLGMRLALALLLPLPVLAWIQPSGFKAFAVIIGAIAFGVLAPKLILDLLAKRLRRQADNELPLLVDLLRLLQGVGFSVDQSLQMIADRFQGVMPLLGREIRDANATYVRGRTRLQSLHRLCEFDNDGLQSLVQIIVQVHEHGGAIQEPLRQFGERLREQRKLRMKETSGKLSVKMTIVMMLTLLPALMLVLAGPAVISLVGTMAKFKGH
jgi:tight adherence protein C